MIERAAERFSNDSSVTARLSAVMSRQIWQRNESLVSVLHGGVDAIRDATCADVSQ